MRRELNNYYPPPGYLLVIGFANDLCKTKRNLFQFRFEPTATGDGAGVLLLKAVKLLPESLQRHAIVMTFFDDQMSDEPFIITRSSSSSLLLSSARMIKHYCYNDNLSFKPTFNKLNTISVSFWCLDIGKSPMNFMITKKTTRNTHCHEGKEVNSVCHASGPYNSISVA